MAENVKSRSVPLMKQALRYASKGIYVIPVHSVRDGRCSCRDSAECSKPGKHPITPRGVKDATTNRKTIKRWWAENPDANIGIATGKISNLVVVDVDGAEGKISLAELVKKNGKLPRTPKVKTGKGEHYYLRPGNKTVQNSVGRLGKGVDIRGDGGYVVAPGSVHQSGMLYEFIKGRGLSDIEIAKAPKWLRKAFEMREALQPQLVLPIPPSKVDRAKAYMASALQREIERLGKAPKHQRNDSLNRSAFKLGQLLPYGLFDRAAIVRDLTRVATDIGLEENEIGATLESGLKAGEGRPRSLPFFRSDDQANAELPSPSPNADLTKELSKLGETDTDNAQRLATRFSNEIIYTKGRGWLVYKEGRWLPEAGPQCIELAKDAARMIAHETQYLGTDQAKAARAQFAKASLSKGGLERMLDLAKGLVAVDDRQLDADLWLFNTANGTVDLRTGYVEKHDPSDLLTQISPVVADRSAKCPLFKKFLKRITKNDKRLIRFIRNAIGYSLTGETKEQVFFFCHGRSGSNGKSTLINLVRDMLGDYGCHTPTETLMTKQYDNAISNDQARLAGVRMVTAIEANFNRQMDEAKIKAMTGGEKITARFMRQEFFEFTPAFKLWLVANDRPRVRGTDTALWRRICVIPFDVEIPQEERDKNLSAKLREEWPGILAWAVRGCIDWQKRGLRPPVAARAAAGEWAKAADHLKRFVDEMLIDDTGNTIAAQPLYDYYTQWCSRNGETGLSMIKFKEALINGHNISHKRTKRGSIWIGVKYRL
ncbi:MULTISPECIES: phage/plasmid primase, P4 family [unclassified Bradyrhizobium]|uniref:phage/plasmid primase, P4 family n=1 Tax=Bradyrhizobium sp. USDA 4541 TaxID=2817704 RepID=UPI0020A4C80D|nr:phage/plasmid primase, P4 family [Bradyrhizobium sp. USDA 4541]MCP1848370.1 putative DNA primase/helicase [Bradyrhizobium sp. USDA 4541]